MLTLLLGLALAQAPEVGWTPVGDVQNFEVTAIQGVCPSTSADGKAFLLRSKSKEATTGVSIVQRFDVKAYAGERVRFSATIDAREVTGTAGLFIRLLSGERAAINSEMRDRLLTGTQPCKSVSLEVDIPLADELEGYQPFPVLSVGATLHGAGTIEVTDVKFERIEKAPPHVVAKPAKPVSSPNGTNLSEAPFNRWNSKPTRPPPPVKRSSSNPP